MVSSGAGRGGAAPPPWASRGVMEAGPDPGKEGIPNIWYPKWFGYMEAPGGRFGWPPGYPEGGLRTRPCILDTRHVYGSTEKLKNEQSLNISSPGHLIKSANLLTKNVQ